MAALILDSLVLPGVAVRLDVRVVDGRLGAGKANPQAPGNRNSMRPPMPGGSLPETRSVFDPTAGYPASGETPGAGRSRRSLGSHACQPATHVGLSWRKPEGRTPPAMAAC